MPAPDTMDLMRAIEIIEMDENATYEDQQRAWQFIYDSGAYASLQGFYGRTVQRLLAEGVIK